MGGNSETGPLEGLANLGIFYNTGIGKKITKKVVRPVDEALGFGPVDTSEVDAMYRQQAAETEKQIQQIQERAARNKPAVFGIRSGGGQSTQGVPTLTSVRAKSGSDQSIFDE